MIHNNETNILTNHSNIVFDQKYYGIPYYKRYKIIGQIYMSLTITCMQKYYDITNLSNMTNIL